MRLIGGMCKIRKDWLFARITLCRKIKKQSRTNKSCIATTKMLNNF